MPKTEKKKEIEREQKSASHLYHVFILDDVKCIFVIRNDIDKC